MVSDPFRGSQVYQRHAVVSERGGVEGRRPSTYRLFPARGGQEAH